MIDDLMVVDPEGSGQYKIARGEIGKPLVSPLMRCFWYALKKTTRAKTETALGLEARKRWDGAS